MRRVIRGGLVVLVIGVVLAGGIWWFYPDRKTSVTPTDSRSAAGSKQRSGPVACVKLVPVRHGTITEQVVVYGSVIPAPGALRTVSIPFESQVVAVMVNEGQKVAEGDDLLRIQASPDTLLQLQQARNAYQLQQESLRQVKRRLALKLATNEQLLREKQTLEQAKLRLQSLTNRGIDGRRTISAQVAGLVKKVNVQEGSLVPAGNALIEIVAQNRVEVRLGIEPEDIDRVYSGQRVLLSRVNVPETSAIVGEVRRISYAVNPATRLVDVFVTLPSSAGFLLGDFISGKIAINSAEGLIAPNSAVLPGKERGILYTVEANRARQHVVSIGISNPTEYQIISKDLKAGDLVVVEGNYELTDGMTVATGGCQ